MLPSATRMAARRPGRHGTASVELAVVLPVLVLLLFGSLEVGMLVRASMTVNRVANEATRMAGVGASPTRITAHIASSSTGLHFDRITTLYQYRQWDTSTNAWGSWTTLGADPLNAADNDAPMGSQVRVTVSYPYDLLFRGLLGPALGASDGEITLPASVITVRGFGEYREQ